MQRSRNLTTATLPLSLKPHSNCFTIQHNPPSKNKQTIQPNFKTQTHLVLIPIPVPYQIKPTYFPTARTRVLTTGDSHWKKSHYPSISERYEDRYKNLELGMNRKDDNMVQKLILWAICNMNLLNLCLFITIWKVVLYIWVIWKAECSKETWLFFRLASLFFLCFCCWRLFRFSPRYPIIEWRRIVNGVRESLQASYFAELSSS